MENIRNFSTSSFLQGIGNSTKSVRVVRSSPSNQPQHLLSQMGNPAMTALCMLIVQGTQSNLSMEQIMKTEEAVKLMEQLQKPETPTTPSQRVSRGEPLNKKFCKICKVSIGKEGEKSNGARRHVLQYHLKVPMYVCSFCPYSSNYDKANVTAHIRKNHAGLGKTVSMPKASVEETRWTVRCFGTRSTDEADDISALEAQVTERNSPPLPSEDSHSDEDETNHHTVKVEDEAKHHMVKVEIEEKECPFLKSIMENALKCQVNLDVKVEETNQEVPKDQEISALSEAE